MRDRFSGAVEAFARRNGSPAVVHGDPSRHRSTDNVPSSKQVETERGRVCRASSASKRVVVSSNRPSSSAEFAESRSNWLSSGGGRVSTTQRVQPGFESKSSSFTRTATSRGGRDDALRSFELLTIGSGKRK